MASIWLEGGDQEKFLRNVGLSDGVPAAGRYLALAGQVGQAPDGSIPEGLREQAVLAMKNIEELIEKAGGSMGDIVHLTVLMSQATLDRKKEWWEIFSDLLRTYLPGVYPAATGYYVVELASRRYLVEIQATAVLGSATE